MDIKNLKLMVIVVAGIANIGGTAYADGKLNASDLPGALYQGSTLIPNLIEIEWDHLLPEAKDLTEAEQGELIATYKEKFDIPNDAIEISIEEILEDVALLVRVIKRNIDRIKRFKELLVPEQGQPVEG